MAVLHQEIIHELNTDCVEFCPSTETPDWLLLGSYQLNEKTGDRHGGIDLFRVEHAAAAARLAPAASVRGIAGVFDARWQQLSDGGEWDVAVALADGSLRLYRPSFDLGSSEGAGAGGGASGAAAAGAEAAAGTSDAAAGAGEAPAEAGPKLRELDHIKAVKEMALCVDWAGGGSRGVAAVSSSGGQITLVKAAESELRRLNEWVAHDLEGWCVAFDKHQPNVLYSGADDCTFKGWDCRAAAPTISWRAPPAAAGPSAGAGGGHAGNADEDEEEDDEDADMALFNNRREHEAGVCCVAPHPSAPHVVATGSYDERIRLWDMRKLSKPVVTSEVLTGGGAWRLRWHPSDPTLMLAACMYNGFAVARAAAGFGAIDIVETYSGHQSIAYGADWYHPPAAAAAAAGGGAAAGAAAGAQQEGAGGGGGGGHLVATCSFYDRRLHLWTTATVC